MKTRSALLALVFLTACGRAAAPPTPPVGKAPEAPIQEAAKAEEPGLPSNFKLEEFKGDPLISHPVKSPLGRVQTEHGLFVFASPESDFNYRFAAHVRHQPQSYAPHLRPSDTLYLYVLWGDRLGNPSPKAIFDRTTSRIVVTANWTGPPMMSTQVEYRGYAFKLGALMAGEYDVWVFESMPVDKDGPKLTRSLTFKVTDP